MFVVAAFWLHAVLEVIDVTVFHDSERIPLQLGMLYG